MYRTAIIVALLAISTGVQAQTYPVSPDEQERREFLNVQQGKFPGVPEPTGKAAAPSATPSATPGAAPFVPTPSPWLNDRPVTPLK